MKSDNPGHTFCSRNLNGFTHTRFVYDGGNLIQERDGTSPGQVVLSYVYGPGSDEVLTRRRTSGGVTSDLFYHTNTLGSVAAVTDITGAVVERYKYDAYGQVTFLNASFTPLTSSAVYNNILFTGRYYDTETKLYYYRARSYHPYLGRFIQRDPLGEAASINLYNYVFNNPVNATDPTGMWTPSPGMLPEEIAAHAPAGASESAWRQREGQDNESMRRAEEEMRKLHGYTAMEDSHAAGLALRELSHWANHYANRQGSRNQQLAQQIQASLTDPNNMKNMENPKGVAVFIMGWRQDAGAEGVGANATMCTENKTEIDEEVRNKQNADWVTITVNADTLAQVGKFNEPSDSGVQMLANAVLGVATAGSMGGQGGSLPIEINGFSRGGGGAIALTNTLTKSGVVGRDITLNLTDPYMGSNSHVINDPSVNTNVSRSVGLHGSNVGLNAIAWIAHFTRNVYQLGAAGTKSRVAPSLYDLPHSQMDNLWPSGALLP